jgi:hypothetical protein
VSLEEEVVQMIQQVVEKLGSLDVVSPSDSASGYMLKRAIRWSRTRE